MAIVDTSETTSTIDLFENETLQLTDAVIANLTALELSDIGLFTFADSPAVEETALLVEKRAAAVCKTYPGDALWPSEFVWTLFDILLGGALIETIPYAAPCYDDFGNFDKSKCDFLTNNWVNGSIYQ